MFVQNIHSNLRPESYEAPDMTGSISQRGRNSWRVAYDLGRDGSGRRIRRQETMRGSYKDAEKRLTVLVSQRDQGFDVEPHRLTVAQFLESWLATHKVTAQSKVRYEQIIRRHVTPSIGTIRLLSLKPMHVQGCLTAAGERVSERTARDVFTLLNMAFAQAVRWQLLPRNPADAVERPKASESSAMRVLVPADVARLLNAARDTDWATLISLTVATGIRRGEVLGLKWTALDLETGTMSVSQSARFQAGEGVVYDRPKTKKPQRVIVLSADTTQLLQDYRKLWAERRLRWGPAWMGGHDLVFTNEMARVSRLAASTQGSPASWSTPASAVRCASTTSGILTRRCSPAPGSTPRS